MSRFSHSCILAVVMFITVIVVPRWGASAHSPSQVAPVAIVTYTTNTGGTTVVDAETVLFDGTSSYDPDGGSITKYRWRINGSVQGTTSTFSWTFDIADGASQTVRLSIWDDENEYKQTDVVLSVVLGGNQSPVASFTPLGSTVNDLQVVPFSSTSTDPDGTISAQEWFVGSLGGTPDGTSTTLSWTVDIGSGTTQTVYLVVEDNDAAKDTTSAVFTVQAAGSQQITRQYYLKDHLGSTRVTVDDAGDVVQYADYYPFGMLLPARNGVFGTSTVRELYTGHQKDDTTGLFYAGARYYDPMIVRWSSIDAFASNFADWNPYNYVIGSPLVLVDPAGNDTVRFGSNGDYIDYIEDDTGEFVGVVLGDDGVILKTFLFNDIGVDRAALENGIQFYDESEIAALWVEAGVAEPRPLIGRVLFVLFNSGAIAPLDFYPKLGGVTNRLYVIDGYAYNAHDAGNYIWGGALGVMNLSEGLARAGAHLNAFCCGKRQNGDGLGLTLRGDSDADQDAIARGYRSVRPPQQRSDVDHYQSMKRSGGRNY